MSKFNRRSYTVKDDDGRAISSLRAKVSIEIGGKTHTAIELRAPGLVAVIARPSSPDQFTIEVIEEGGRRYTDFYLPPEAGVPLPWQEAALAGDG